MEQEQLSQVKDQRYQVTLEQIREIRKPWNRNNYPGYRSKISGNPGTGTVLQDTDQRDQGTLEQEQFSRIKIRDMRELWNRNNSPVFILGNTGTEVLQ